MDSQQQKYFEEWRKEQAKIKSRMRKKKRLADEGGVTLNSLMDALFIILIFLLMNFSADPMKIQPSEKLQLPPSTTQLGITDKTVTITIEESKIMVNDTVLSSLNVDKIDPSKLEITELKRVLDQKVKDIKKQNESTFKTSFKDMITIIAHGETKYRLINQVMYTAGISSFTKFKFAVTKGGILRQSI